MIMKLQYRSPNFQIDLNQEYQTGLLIYLHEKTKMHFDLKRELFKISLRIILMKQIIENQYLLNNVVHS